MDTRGRTVELEEVRDVRAREQVPQHLCQVVHGLAAAPGPGLGDHGRHEGPEAAQVAVGEALQDADLRLRGRGGDGSSGRRASLVGL